MSVLLELLRVVEGVRQHVEAGSEELRRGRCVDGQLAGVAAAGEAGDGDDVADAEGRIVVIERLQLAADAIVAGDALDLSVIPYDVVEDQFRRYIAVRAYPAFRGTITV